MDFVEPLSLKLNASEKKKKGCLNGKFSSILSAKSNARHNVRDAKYVHRI